MGAKLILLVSVSRCSRVHDEEIMGVFSLTGQPGRILQNPNTERPDLVTLVPQTEAIRAIFIRGVTL